MALTSQPTLNNFNWSCAQVQARVRQDEIDGKRHRDSAVQGAASGVSRICNPTGVGGHIAKVSTSTTLLVLVLVLVLC